MKQKMRKYVLASLIFSIVLLSISLGILAGNYISENGLSFRINKLSQSELSNDSLNCYNLSLEQSASCLRNYVLGFYNFTIRDDTDKSLEDLKENGGDCYDYSLLYVKLAKEIGLNAEKQSIFQGEGGHAFAIIWDNDFTGYCKLDLLSIDCVKFKENDENE